MDILTRIRNSEFRAEVLKVLQSAKINEQIRGAELVNEIPISNMNDVYHSIIAKLVQTIKNKEQTSNNTMLLHDVVLMALCKSKKGKKFDKYYDDILSDIDKNMKISSKLFID